MKHRRRGESAAAVALLMLVACALAPTPAAARAARSSELVLRAHRLADTFIIHAAGTDRGSYSIDGSRRVRFAGIRSLTIDGDGGRDVCRIVNPPHGLFAPAGGIACNGGNRRGEPRRGDLQLVGGRSVGSVYAPGSRAGAGTSVHRLGGIRQVIHFTGLAPVTDTIPSGQFTFSDSVGSDIVALLSNGTAGTVTIESLSSPAAFESVTISNKVEVTIDASAPDDAVVLENQASEAGLASLAVNASGPISLLGSNLAGVPVSLNSGEAITAAGTAPNLTATSLAATAPDGIGPLNIDVGTLAADSTAGAVDIENAGPLTLAPLMSLAGVTAGGDISVSSDSAGGEIVSAAPVSGRAVSLTADGMSLSGGSITAAGTATLAPATAGVPVNLGAAGGPAGELDLSAGDLNTVHAPQLDIGGPDVGAITVSGALAPAAVDTLGLIGPDGFAAAGGSIIAHTLALTDVGFAGRPWTIGPAAVADGSGTAIPYSAVATLEVYASGGSDTFDVTPSPTTTYQIDGGGPASAPGDTLSYQAGGRVIMATGTAPAGAIDAPGLAPLLYTGIEGVTVVDPGVAVAPGTTIAPSGAVAGSGPPTCTLELPSSRVISAHSKQSASLSLLAACSQMASGRLTGAVTVNARSSKKKVTHLALRPLSMAIGAGKIVRLIVSLPAAAVKALRSGVREAVSFTLVATDAAGVARAAAHIARLTR